MIVSKGLGDDFDGGSSIRDKYQIEMVWVSEGSGIVIGSPDAYEDPCPSRQVDSLELDVDRGDS